MQDKTNMVLRYFIGEEEPEKRYAQLTDFLSRSGIRRVILFTAPFSEASSIFPREYYRKSAAAMAPYVEDLKKRGVEVGINSLYTVGHAYYADETETGFRRAVTLSGEPSRGCVCFRDEAFLSYIKEIYGYYAQLHPSVIFTDDDIRGNSLGQIVCFCDEHIRLISEKIGKPLTREEIRRHIETPEFSHDEIREAYFDFLSEDVAFLLKTVADAVHAISPETELGAMLTSYPTVTLDRDLSVWGKTAPVTRLRTGMDFYREGALAEAPRMFSMPIVERDLLGDSAIELQPEVENDTYGFYYKSNNVTHLQLLWCIANGFRNMQLNLFHLFNCPADHYEEITGLFEKNAPYYAKAAELIPENSRSEGVGIYASPRALRVRRAQNGFLYSPGWLGWLPLMGIPLSGNAKASPWLLLTGDDIAAADDGEIDALLGKGAFIDARAAEALVFRGYGERIGIREISVFRGLFSGEHLTDDALNGSAAGKHNSDYLYNSLQAGLLREISYKGHVRVLSRIVNHRGESVIPGLCAYENEAGERFCILPFDYNLFTQFSMVSTPRREQLLFCFAWIARRELPVTAEDARVSVVLNRYPDKNVLTLFNFSTDDIPAPKLRYKPRGKLYLLSEDGTLVPLPYKNDNECILLESELRAVRAAMIADVL